MALGKREQQYFEYLAQRIRLGDEAAFAELYEQTYENFYRYAAYFLKDPEQVLDALQEIYIAVYKNIHLLKLDRLILPWMKQIAYHVCCDFVRESRLRQTVPLSDEFLPADFDAATPAAVLSEDECFQAVFDRDLSLRLNDALEKLSHKERQAFRLRYEGGLKLEEVAEVMDVSLASAKRYIMSARKSLRYSLQDLKAHT